MIAPPFCSRITGSTCLHGKTTLLRFTDEDRSQASSLTLRGAGVAAADADVVVQHVDAAVAAHAVGDSAAQSASRVASAQHGARLAVLVVDLRRRSRSADSRRRSTATTRAPSRANSIAVARPLPMVSPGVCPRPIDDRDLAREAAAHARRQARAGPARAAHRAC